MQVSATVTVDEPSKDFESKTNVLSELELLDPSGQLRYNDGSSNHQHDQGFEATFVEIVQKQKWPQKTEFAYHTKPKSHTRL